MNLAELRRSGQTVLVKRGCFYVPESRELANFGWFRSVAEKAVTKFIKRFESDGWTLRSEPLVRKVKLADEDAKRVAMDSKGDVALRFPADHRMRRDHPWYRPECDMYEVTAWFSKANELVVFDLSDKHVSRLIKSGKFPTSLKLAE